MAQAKFKYCRQLESMDCAPTCIQMIAKYYGKDYTLHYLREKSFITRTGVSLLGISEGAESIGLKTMAVRSDTQKLINEAPLPCILHWRQEHFVVLVDIQNKGHRDEAFIIADPAFGKIKLNRESFNKFWVNDSIKNIGIALFLQPSEEFYKRDPPIDGTGNSIKQILSYLKLYKALILQILLGMLLLGLVNLLPPILTQKLIDLGVNKGNSSVVVAVCASQLLIAFGSISIDYIRSLTIFHISTRVSLNIISNFLIKLTKLPISFFDTKLLSDITTRLDDNHRIESFLTSSSIGAIFSFFNFTLLSIVLFIYSPIIFFIFLIASCLTVLWIFTFLKKRKYLDYGKFEVESESKNSIYELITGMEEIKLYNCEKNKRWDWEKLQIKLFGLNKKSLKIEQEQRSGTELLTQIKNISITFISANLVIGGDLTLGAMLGISYIIGQMNSPIDQLIRFLVTAQDAKISFDRLCEINNGKNEDSQKTALFNKELDYNHGSISLKNIYFKYYGPNAKWILEDLSLDIPLGKVTAIVGASGSGKTTLMKILLKFYSVDRGSISINATQFMDLNPNMWREQCGTVMQDGYIFSDNIAKNITLSDENYDLERLNYACRMANVSDFVSKLPLGYNTKIGNAGNGLSIGQKQRILIARAIYKNPIFLFFDEATSALDANNEKDIMSNLNEFSRGKTVVVIAHRLSTVKNADQIVVLNEGKIVELGNHETLKKINGEYYNLVKNQLELGA